MNIYENLEKDHGKQRGLAAGICETQGDSAERRRLWGLYRTELTAHASAEEQTLYATLIAKHKGQSEAQHSIAEHKVLEDIIADLETMEMSSSGWLNRFNTLRDKVEHHLEEEERDVFPLARRLIGEQEALDLSTEFDERKEREVQVAS